MNLCLWLLCPGASLRLNFDLAFNFAFIYSQFMCVCKKLSTAKCKPNVHYSYFDCRSLARLHCRCSASLQTMPYPRYGESGQDGENYRRNNDFRTAPNPWQGPEMNAGLTNVNPMALVGNLVGVMVGQMAGGGDGGLGALMALQASGQHQVQSGYGDGWPHSYADHGGMNLDQIQVANPSNT